MPGSASISGTSGATADSIVTPVTSASTASVLSTSSTSIARRHRLQRQLLRPRELQESLHDIVEPPNLAADDVDVRFGGLTASAPAASFCFSSSR